MTFKWRNFRASAVLILTTFGVSHQVLAQPDKTEQIGAFHLSLYHDVQGSVLDLEAYTKTPDKAVFFGVTCSAMSPFPAVQVLLFEDEILSETPRLLNVTYQIDAKTGDLPLQGVLKAELNAEHYLNQIRFEVDAAKIGKNMRLMQQAYGQLLDALAQGKLVTFVIEHRALGKHSYQFTLQGLAQVLQPYERICR
ncbi:hypothetical protein THMIRHAS_03610 [Thiosulfatimonas sediminis]|uniref:Uncharacterized protein n=1 Tax=Thiosulfatimonas sediminis TaxID=2675054 RepID=A0A6F8PSJ2_9GAMM|nr:hypothetical protein [Thiosulfatimonas sediminis]BBP44988.1 hypothetical protein THMIRHAS_03610 [Thiosulfatimonas sediminis]